MKGQISFVEYLVSTTIFIAFTTYFFFNLVSLVPAYLNEIRSERVRSEAYQISEILVNDPGEPINWDLSNVKRLGFSDENFNKTNLLSENKINMIGPNCIPGYDEVKKLIGTDLDFMLVLIERPNGQLKMLCSPT
ncbi:MAG: hypothetical protein QMD12_00985, partial [Candidatus Aenigmarchaeota archaeon]|nr:hypothetical protein [Candidatus Aenigmarchaeota archaeon]